MTPGGKRRVGRGQRALIVRTSALESERALERGAGTACVRRLSENGKSLSLCLSLSGSHELGRSCCATQWVLRDMRPLSRAGARVCATSSPFSPASSSSSASADAEDAGAGPWFRRRAGRAGAGRGGVGGAAAVRGERWWVHVQGGREGGTARVLGGVNDKGRQARLDDRPCPPSRHVAPTPPLPLPAASMWAAHSIWHDHVRARPSCSNTIFRPRIPSRRVYGIHTHTHTHTHTHIIYIYQIFGCDVS